ncbi:mechanosensitive ion channel family protein [Luteimonas sp. RD2P54]|uniref:Small-conductance mechanosensitive channel n=1 Tax=Luteimonas endophytica TaxID=3042023 RepID=A0ABT6J6V7_9GAMM|nr:mechanosensitive ion channel family protein [Luteimonas endophytica]MDH5822550.1 mechanosensitive ion channel family protein [Luteimonas endophytica]
MNPSRFQAQLPPWLHAWLGEIALAMQVVAILLAAWVLRWLLVRMVRRLSARYDLPFEVSVAARRIVGFLVGFGALLLVLERFGVSGGVLWTAFTGFAAVAAIAFFAAWSVLTNVFCALLLLILRPFRLLDHIELIENGERAGFRGRVVDMNLVFVTLEEKHEGGESLLRVPNSLFFQRATRRWLGEPVPVALPPRRPDDSDEASLGGTGGGAASQFP